MGGSLPDTCVSILRALNAPLSLTDKSLVLASVRGNLGMAAEARKLKRLLGPMGDAVRRDILAATDTEEKAKDALEGGRSWSMSCQSQSKIWRKRSTAGVREESRRKLKGKEKP